jgi:hypothetical protein
MTYVFHSKILSGVSRYYSVMYQIKKKEILLFGVRINLL